MEELLKIIKQIHSDVKSVEFTDMSVITFFNAYSEHVSKDRMGYHYSGAHGEQTKLLDTEEEAIKWVKDIGRVKPNENCMAFRRAMKNQLS